MQKSIPSPKERAALLVLGAAAMQAMGLQRGYVEAFQKRQQAVYYTAPDGYGGYVDERDQATIDALRDNHGAYVYAVVSNKALSPAGHCYLFVDRDMLLLSKELRGLGEPMSSAVLTIADKRFEVSAYAMRDGAQEMTPIKIGVAKAKFGIARVR